MNKIYPKPETQKLFKRAQLKPKKNSPQITQITQINTSLKD